MTKKNNQHLLFLNISVLIGILILAIGSFIYNIGEVSSSCEGINLSPGKYNFQFYQKGDGVLCKLQNGQFSPSFDLDYKSFKVLNQPTATLYADNYNVFYRLGPETVKQIQGINRKEVEIINTSGTDNVLYRDDKNVFYNDAKIPELDLNSVRVERSWVYDDSNCFLTTSSNLEKVECDGEFEWKLYDLFNVGGKCYLGTRLIENCDGKTFEVVKGGLIGGRPSLVKDKDNVFNTDGSISQFGTGFRNINDDFAADENQCYFRSFKSVETIEGCDPNTIERLDKYYAKDINFVYSSWANRKGEIGFEGLDKYIFENADPNSFVIGPNVSYDGDNNNCYYSGLLMRDDCTAQNIQAIDTENRHLMTDGSSVFHFGREIFGVDLNSLETISKNHVKDNDSVWYQGFQLDGADPDTFEIFRQWPDKVEKDPENYSNVYEIYEPYAIDKNNTYYGFSILTDVDLDKYMPNVTDSISTDGKNHYCYYLQIPKDLAAIDKNPDYYCEKAIFNQSHNLKLFKFTNEEVKQLIEESKTLAIQAYEDQK